MVAAIHIYILAFPSLLAVLLFFGVAVTDARCGSNHGGAHTASAEHDAGEQTVMKIV